MIVVGKDNRIVVRCVFTPFGIVDVTFVILVSKVFLPMVFTPFGIVDSTFVISVSKYSHKK